jgi:hypothetical protein
MGGDGPDLHPQINPRADVHSPRRGDDPPMSITDYLIDSTLVLLVLVQMRDRRLTTRELVRPLIILGIAVMTYLHGIPTAGNDLVLVAVFALVGGLIGMASGQTVKLRQTAAGEVIARAGWLSAFFWVLGMGSRFAFVYWISHFGHSTIATFSAQHSITSGEAWTAALLAMAVFEVGSRTAVLAVRRYRLQRRPAAELAGSVRP